MSLKNQVILKAALSNAAMFIVVWLGILAEAWLDSEDEVSVKGALISFLLLQTLALILTFRVKMRLDRNPIK
ncbi:hypothetical protein swp_4053 [Shewanella piezotolerans WP3]|uniref:Uncharacterized protein n=1 Tax=Shewanella piezotolerans (strain WP3 / JCM 13877) TaxID=225849 RepID=B8CSU5_SHEPW|nr:hypothetical protein [Shewanella piezotolerans]ACJ30721.1 hypothetical protein swp_4053 [Shewanella piezotolerans WP3]